jgi:hypothetical protein
MIMIFKNNTGFNILRFSCRVSAALPTKRIDQRTFSYSYRYTAKLLLTFVDVKDITLSVFVSSFIKKISHKVPVKNFAASTRMDPLTGARFFYVFIAFDIEKLGRDFRTTDIMFFDYAGYHPSTENSLAVDLILAHILQDIDILSSTAVLNKDLLYTDFSLDYLRRFKK